MNYLSIYNSIINRAISENRYKKSHSHPNYEYYERHHIIPRCLGGSDQPSNLVLLTAREHFVCHQLLVKIYPGNYKITFALNAMCITTNRNHIRNNRQYEWIRKLVAVAFSESQKGKSYGNKFQKGHTLSIGENNGMSGKEHRKESKDKMSEKAQLRDNSYYDFARLPKSKEHKENISKSKRTRKFKLIDPDGKEYVLNTIHEASKISGISNSTLVKLAGNRYGFDNCRGWKIIEIPLS